MSDASAELSKAALREAINDLQETLTYINSAKSNTTTARTRLNTSSDATTDAIVAQTNSLNKLHEAMGMAQSALLGTSNTDATVALVWLTEVSMNLSEDTAYLNQIKHSIQTLVARADQIIKNNEQEVKHINDAIEALNSQIGRLG